MNSLLLESIVGTLDSAHCTYEKFYESCFKKLTNQPEKMCGTCLVLWSLLGEKRRG